jgi:hypothetical protein
MTKAVFSRLAPLALGSALGLALMVGGVEAREHGDKSHAHARDFYAVADEGPAANAVAAAPANHSKCFTSSTPMEAARGIRHWSGGC